MTWLMHGETPLTVTAVNRLPIARASQTGPAEP